MFIGPNFKESDYTFAAVILLDDKNKELYRKDNINLII